MNASTLAQILSHDQDPDLLGLQTQSYEIMAADYASRNEDKAFPLDLFAERVYQMRLDDQTSLDDAEFANEILAMERHKLLLLRVSDAANGEMGRGDSAAAISTVNGEMACLKSLFSEAMRAGLVQINPVRGIRLMNPNNVRDRILSNEETARLFAAAGEMDDFVRSLFHVLFHTGMRLGEALALEWADIEFDHQRLVIRQSKSGEGRKVPLRDVLADELIRWRPLAKGSQWVYPARHDASKPMQSIRKGWLRLCQAAGVTNLRPHDLRHNFTSVLQAQGVSDSIIMSITGHKTHVMLHRYSHAADASKAAAIDALPAPTIVNEPKVTEIRSRTSSN